MKILISSISISGQPSWWAGLTKVDQERYLALHPHSRLKVGGGKAVVYYHPDVVNDVDHDGITKAARVGVPGREVPTPPPVPRLPNLTKTERLVESKFASDFESDPEAMATSFLDLVRAVSTDRPPTFGTDDAKILTSEWAGEPGLERSQNRATLNVALHQTANAVAKRAFLKHLDTLNGGDSIMVTVGGCGAGKGYSLGNVDIAKNAASASKAVWDSAGDQNATENPWIQEEAEKRGLKVTYVYVHADPKVSWADPKRGVVKRANNPEDGRMVDAQVFADSYAIGAKNHKLFSDRHKDNPNASFIFIDSENKAPTLVHEMPASALKIDRARLSKFAHAELKKSDAPEHIKRGGSVGLRIWGDKK